MQNQTAIDKKRKLEKLKNLRAKKLQAEQPTKADDTGRKASADADDGARDEHSEQDSEVQTADDFLQRVVHSMNAMQKSTKLAMTVQDDGDEDEQPVPAPAPTTKPKASKVDRVQPRRHLNT